MSTRVVDLVPGELRAVVSWHDAGSDAVPCATWRSEGLRAHGHPEVTLTLRRLPNEDPSALSLDAMRFFLQCHERAKANARVEAGSLGEFPAGLFEAADPLGVIFARPVPLGDAAVVARGLAAVVVHRDELGLARSHGPRRVLSRLARAARYAPFPPWWDADRPSVAHPDDPTSVLEPTARVQLRGVTAALVGHDVRLRMTARDAASFARALDAHAEGAPCAILVDAPPEADAFLVWSPGQRAPAAATSREGVGRCVGGSFVLFAPGAPDDRGALVEDGFAFALRDDTWGALRAALAGDGAFALASREGSRGLVLERAPDAPPTRPSPVRFARVEVLAGYGRGAPATDPDGLAGYVSRVRAVVDAHLAETWASPAQELMLHLELHPGRATTADLALRPGPAGAAFNGLCAAVSSLEAPAVKTPAVLRVLFTVWDD